MNYALGIIVILLLAVGGGYYYYTDYQKEVEARQAEILAQEQAAIEEMEREKEIKTSFENALQNFTSNLRDLAATYKKKRYVVKDMTRPISLRDPAYVQENYMIAQDMIPQIRQDMEGFMEQFVSADKKINDFIKTTQPANPDMYRDQWQGLKDEYLELYTSYFLIESEILTILERLITFYVENQDDYEVDVQTNTLSFSDENTRIIHDEYQRRLEQLQQEQNTLLTNYVRGEGVQGAGGNNDGNNTLPDTPAAPPATTIQQGQDQR